MARVDKRFLLKARGEGGQKTTGARLAMLRHLRDEVAALEQEIADKEGQGDRAREPGMVDTAQQLGPTNVLGSRSEMGVGST